MARCLNWGNIHMIEHKFFELIQIAVGNLESFKETPTDNEWGQIFVLTQEQSLVGVLLEAIEELPKNQKPPKDLLLEWIAQQIQITENNKMLNQYARELKSMFAENAFNTCILKGQGTALFYPKPELRQSGDIDIWIEGNRKEVLRFLSNRFHLEKQGWHHTPFEYNGVEVEVHHHPSKLYNFSKNKKLQQYYSEQWPIQCQNTSKHGYNVPNVEFAYIYCLLHIYGHVLGEGVGLRQIMDLYYIGKALPVSSYLTVQKFIEDFKLERLMGMLAYVLHEVFGQEAIIFPINEKDGKYLLRSIMHGGNFGKYNKHYRSIMNGNKAMRGLKKFFLSQIAFLKYFPSEVLWIIPWRLWLALYWRPTHIIKF